MAKITGNTTATPMAVPDLAQTDERKANYIKNKKVSYLENDIGYAEKTYVDGKIGEIDEALNEIIASGIADIYSTADDTGRQMVVIITLTDGRQLSFGVPYGEKGEDGVGIDNVYTLPYEGGRGVVLQLSNGLVYSFDVNDGYTPQKGVDYWTEEDKAEIIAEIPKGGTWEKLADITTTEEVNSIIATAEEFPDMPKCKEFIIRGVFPKSPTGENISLGALRVDFNNTSGICFYFASTNINKDVMVENRVHSIIANKFVFSVGTQGASGQAAVIANANTLIGERFLYGDVTQIIYRLNTVTNAFPIGTRLYIYGKVEG